MKTKVVIVIVSMILMNSYAVHAQKTKDVKNLIDLIDLSGFNLTVEKVRTVADSLQLDENIVSIKDEHRKENQFVIISLKGIMDRNGIYMLSPSGFVAEYFSDNMWKTDPASALGNKIELMDGQVRTFWIQSGVASTMQVEGKKGSELNIEIVFILPRDAMTIKLGVIKFFAENVAIN